MRTRVRDEFFNLNEKTTYSYLLHYKKWNVFIYLRLSIEDMANYERVTVFSI